MSWADDMFEAAFAIAKVMAERRAIVREARRLRRNERARRRYAINKILPKKPKPVPESERDYEPETSCHCSIVRHPPCSWCENYNPDET